jgi:predicted transposase/invertase (TIGR01784 family)
MNEWNWDDALQVQREEGKEEGREEERVGIAKNALNKGASLDFVQEITGLPIKEIKRIAKE